MHIAIDRHWQACLLLSIDGCAIAYVVGCCVYGKKRAAKLLAK